MSVTVPISSAPIVIPTSPTVATVAAFSGVYPQTFPLSRTGVIVPSTTPEGPPACSGPGTPASNHRKTTRSSGLIRPAGGPWPSG